VSGSVLAEIFGPDGLIVIAVVVVVLLFGGSQLPKLARGLGSASHEFKKGLEQGERPGQAAQAAQAVETPKESSGS
jgi:sec-independent protein translocase protein TatA